MRAFLFLLSIAAATVQTVPQVVRSDNVTVPAADGYWYEVIDHNGISPAIPNGKNWVVYRNVKDYGAKGDGSSDDTAAIQKAIDTGNESGDRASGKFGQTGQSAVVYFPPGTYVTSGMLQNRVGTLWMGDPTDRPVIKASASFKGTYMVNGVDPHATGLVAFHYALRNLIFDTTAMPPTSKINILEWSVSQATQVANVMFNMPVGATGHGAIIAQGQCSSLILNDLQIIGGAVGYQGTTTQFHFKSILFKGMAILQVQNCTVRDVH